MRSSRFCFGSLLQVVFLDFVALWAILLQWNSSLTTNPQGPSSTPAGQAPQAARVPTSGDVSQPSVVEVNSISRRALPEVILCLY